MALNGHAKNRGRDWDRRVDALMRVCKFDTTAKMARRVIEVRRRGEVIEALAASQR